MTRRDNKLLDGVSIKTFAASVQLEKINTEAGQLSKSTTATLHVFSAENEDEARGIAVSKALKLKPGYSIWEILLMEVRLENAS